jgi:hypothetical protein
MVPYFMFYKKWNFKQTLRSSIWAVFLRWNGNIIYLDTLSFMVYWTFISLDFSSTPVLWWSWNFIMCALVRFYLLPLCLRSIRFSSLSLIWYQISFPFTFICSIQDYGGVADFVLWYFIFYLRPRTWVFSLSSSTFFTHAVLWYAYHVNYNFTCPNNRWIYSRGNLFSLILMFSLHYVYSNYIIYIYIYMCVCVCLLFFFCISMLYV